MTLNSYQDRTRGTAVYGNGNKFYGLLYTVLGLNGEAGEVAEILKKELRKGHNNISKETKLKLVDELGDVLWYVASACFELNIRLDYVAEANLHKLWERKRDGKIKDR